MVLFPEEISSVLQQYSSVVIVIDHAARPLISHSDSSWCEVPCLVRHRGRSCDPRSLKKKTKTSRWTGCEETQVKLLQSQQQHNRYPSQIQHALSVQQNLESQQSQPVENSQKPMRKASMEMTPHSFREIHRLGSRCPLKPTRKQSMEMAGAVLSSQGNGLQKPMRKASMDMGITAYEDNQYKNCDHTDDDDSISSNTGGDMIDLIFAKGQQHPLIIPNAGGGLRIPQRKASMDTSIAVTSGHEYNGIHDSCTTCNEMLGLTLDQNKNTHSEKKTQARAA